MPFLVHFTCATFSCFFFHLLHSKPVECNRTTFRGASAKEIGKAVKELYRALFPASRAGGKRDEPAVIRNRDGEYIRMPVSAAKELVRHSAENSTLQLIPNLKELIAKSVFLYEDAKDPDRVKKLNQSTVSYRYYGMKIKLDGKECFARIVVREEANGRKYFYDGDITEIKKNPAQTGGPDSKNGVQSEGVLFTHSIQEWLVKVKETTDKIGGNGEVLPSVVNNFEESSTYHQMAGEYAHNVLSGKSTKKDMGERQLDADEKSFADSVERFIAGKEKLPMVCVMTTPLVLELTGAEGLPVEIAKTDLEKILNGKHAGDKTLEIMKQLPRALTNPIMIFKSYTGPNGEERRVVVVDLKDSNGATIVVPFELKVTTRKNYEINRIASAYGKTKKKSKNPSYEWFNSQLDEGNLLYVNRKKAINEILQRSPNWPMPEGEVDNLLSAPNVANEEDLVKLKSENPTYYQTAADKDLVAYHNVSTGKLREAIKLGGLPMPSLAITKRDIPFGEFGEITMIGDKDMINPRKSRSNEVFSRDAYTVRKPVVNYEEPAKIDSDTFHKKYEETRKFFKKNSIDVGEINFSFQSLKQLEDEGKQKIRVKTCQRNLWIIIAGGALYACISK